MIYFCCDERRRNAVADHPGLNGIDFLEVSDDPADPTGARQRTLFVHFIKPVSSRVLTERNVIIEGGERIRSIKVTRVTMDEVSSPPLSSPISSPPGIDAERDDRGGVRARRFLNLHITARAGY